MEMQVLPWIKDDIAIEIIGKMIAEQTKQLYKLVEEYKQAGLNYDSAEVAKDIRYQQLMVMIGEFKKEIDQIYNGEGLAELYKKVDQEYVPHLNLQRDQLIIAA